MSFYNNLPYILHTRKSKYFADLIAKKLRYPMLPVIRKQFSDGESYYKLTIQSKTALMGKDAILVCSMVDDQELLECVRIGLELSELGTQRRIFIIPYLLYQTMSRANLPGEVVTCKSTVRMLSNISTCGLGNTYLLLDLHRFEIIHYFERTQAVELYAQKLLFDCIADKIDFSKGDITFGTADLGRPKWVETYSSHFGVGLVLCRAPKEYNERTVESMKEPVGDVEGKHVIVYDDMVRSSKTIIAAVENYLKHGATKVSAVITHFAVFDEEAVKALVDSKIDLIITTNSHQHSQLPIVAKSKKIVVIDVSDVFIEQIKKLINVEEGPRTSSPLALAFE